MPDACDPDLDGDGIPDACEIHGDMNCDGFVDMDDVAAFALALVNPAAYQLHFPSCDVTRADMNFDGTNDGRDLQDFANAVMGL